jgi:hypothetical protein
MKVFFDYQVFSIQKFGGASKYFIKVIEKFSNEVEPLVLALIHKNFYLKNLKKKINLFYLDKDLIF